MDDYSPNILLYTQDEVAGAHWDHVQIFVHSTIVFYICNNGFVVREETIHLTNDRRHDDVFMPKSLEHLHNKGVKITIIID